ncbi:hypothetical protein HKD37_06G014692 [Glycine soja]
MRVDRLLVRHNPSSYPSNKICLRKSHQCRCQAKPDNFCDIHDRYMTLLRMLLSKKRKIQRILTIKRVCKKVGGIGLIVSPSVLLVALLVFAFHSVIGLVVVAPCIVGLVIRKRFKWSEYS